MGAIIIMTWKHHILHNGFTLVEFIIVVILLSILSATVVVKLSAQAKHSVTTRADEFRRNLSHIQLLAISQSRRLRLSVNSGNYTVVICTVSDCSSTSALIDPVTGQNFNVNFAPDTPDVTFTSASTLDFDSLGRPQSGGMITSAQIYTLTGSGNCVDVSLLPITGFAQTAVPNAC